MNNQFLNRPRNAEQDNNRKAYETLTSLLYDTNYRIGGTQPTNRAQENRAPQRDPALNNLYNRSGSQDEAKKQ